MSENKQSKKKITQNSGKKSTIPGYFIPAPALNDITNQQNGGFTTTPRKREQKPKGVKSQGASKSKRIKKEPSSNKKSPRGNDLTQSVKKQRNYEERFHPYDTKPRSQPTKCRKRLPVDNLKPSTSTPQDDDLIIDDDGVIDLSSSPEILNDAETNLSSDSEVNIQTVALISQPNLLELSKTSGKTGTSSNKSNLKPGAKSVTKKQTKKIKSKKVTTSSPSTLTQPFIRSHSRDSVPKTMTQNVEIQYKEGHIGSTSSLNSNNYDTTLRVKITNTPKKTKFDYRRQSVAELAEDIVGLTYEKNSAYQENANDTTLKVEITNTPKTTKIDYRRQSVTEPAEDKVELTYEKNSASQENANDEDFSSIVADTQSLISSSQVVQNSSNDENPTPPPVIAHPESSIGLSDYNSSNDEDSVPGPDHPSNGYEDNDVQPASQHSVLPMHYRSQNFHTYENHSNAIIDRGSFGTILIAFNQTLSLVAIKCIQCPPNNTHIANKIVKEIDLHRIGRSPNVIPIYGVMTLNSSVGIIMEYMHAGNLKNLLLNRDINIQPGLILRMFWEAAKGIAFLHNALMDQGIIHGDLKPSNFMLDSDLHVKVGDLGGSRLASITGSSQELRTGTEGETTLAYMAPERLENHNTMTRESDVYSFAICMWVGLTRSEPVVGNRTEFQLSVINGQRPSIENINDERNIDNNASQNAIIPDMKDTMQECWSQNPSERPTMIEVRDRLEDVLKYEAMADIANHATQVSLQMQLKHFPTQSDHTTVCLENFNHF